MRTYPLNPTSSSDQLEGVERVDIPSETIKTSDQTLFFRIDVVVTTSFQSKLFGTELIGSQVGHQGFIFFALLLQIGKVSSQVVQGIETHAAKVPVHAGAVAVEDVRL